MKEEEEETQVLKSSSWSKVVVRKWLNIKCGSDEFHSDYTTKDFLQRRRSSWSGDRQRNIVPEELSDTSDEIEPGFELPVPTDTISLDLKMFVGTWNVGGITPPEDMNISDWLNKTKTPADIYVLGFQEIVPLNAANVLGPEDCGPAAKWLSLIRKSLNGDMINPVSKQSLRSNDQQQPYDSVASDHDDHQSSKHHSKVKQHKYCLAASKQMVGIFLCVWVRMELIHQISCLKVSCVGRGIMGYLGDKGSISISMTLHQTTICFVCAHLASGEKKGYEIRRNSDVKEILRRTRFSNSCKIPGKPIHPRTILNHDKIIWLGDLNYRLASISDDTYKLLERNDWQALLGQDQLRIAQKSGKVFQGWEEGEIHFAPTYKYSTNSDNYVCQISSTPKHERRTPAWCDRILWKGEGLKQMCYDRINESRFSDHRPVYSVFSVQVNYFTRNLEHIISLIPSETVISSRSGGVLDFLRKYVGRMQCFRSQISD